MINYFCIGARNITVCNVYVGGPSQELKPDRQMSVSSIEPYLPCYIIDHCAKQNIIFYLLTWDFIYTIIIDLIIQIPCVKRIQQSKRILT